MKEMHNSECIVVEVMCIVFMKESVADMYTQFASIEEIRNLQEKGSIFSSNVIFKKY